MATKVKTKSKTKFAATKQSVTKQQSTTLLKNMFRISISSICYLRALFPDECFKHSKYGSQEVHQLQCAEYVEGGEVKILHEEAFMLSQWLEKSVFEALIKEYLRSMTFMIYTTNKETSEDVVLETYTFNVAYPEKGKPFGTINGEEISIDNTKQQAIQFIKHLVDFSSTLESLPEERYLTLRLRYYEDRYH